MNAALKEMSDVTIGNLSDELADFLDHGFREVDGAVFFQAFFKEDELPDRKFIVDTLADLSGYEYSVNKLHLDAYIAPGDEPLAQGLLFLDAFSSLWRSRFTYGITAILSYDPHCEIEGVVHKTCMFTFHRTRTDQVVIKPAELEAFGEPLLIQEINALES